MALSETVRPAIVPAARATRSRIPITARELVEWTYAVQRAQGVPELTLEPQGRSQTGIVVDRMIEFAQLGCKVDVSSNAAAIWGEARCHEDAMTVHAIVHGLPWHQQHLLIDHGRSRTAPDWNPKIFPLACVAVQGSKGRPKGIYHKGGNRLVGSEIAYEGDWPDQEFAVGANIAAEAHKRLWGEKHNWSAEPFRRRADEARARARDVYRDWCEALWALCDSLEAAGPRALQRYRINALGAGYEPWRT